ncbi:OmpH family outer membrane protein [Sporomusa acidovorans]|uniref:Outer membrane protein (OmpH-like) n=1 Tax=Sporomusa acidovorans (strain ATCC 49682 / DSM 3132 / Mol) TaxID=1123286 RepID=A0ABZ3J9E6_SPOA4|nr:OmpH family outer membrane protein [Sporomusa acidovorans]OZC16141.1 periplasmic chaperone [Sporomusa acidovorans DSM 3132]SDE28948.1 periplasmic chaperone for outer membrane proteins Skp [Sporomusa acidovorans]
MKQTNTQIRKQITAIIAVFFAFGIVGVFMPTAALASPAKSGQSIGYVNRQQVFAGYPGIQDLMNRIQAMRAEAQKDYDANAKGLPPADKKAYSDKLAQQEAQREDELMKPVGDKIEAAIKAVAAEKGLTVILDAGAVVYGGTDITADVIGKVTR